MFSKTERLITAIDIADNLLKVFTITNDKKGSTLTVVDSVKLPADDEKAIAREVRLMVSRNKVAKSYFIVNFPRHLVTIKSIRLPTTNESEIRNMAELQAIKYLPYSREEIVISHKMISMAPEGYSDILLVLVQKRLVSKYINIFRYAGINVEKIGLSSEGILNWYARLGRKDSDSVGIIDVDSYHTHIQVVKDKNLLFTRSISFDAGAADPDMNILLREIKLSLDSYYKEKNENVSRLIVSGGEDCSKKVADFLKANMAVPCEIVGQLGGLNVEKAAKQSLDKFKNISYNALLGLAMLSENIEVNLIPYDMLEKKKEDAAKRELVKSAVLLLCILVAFFGILEKKMIGKRIYLRNLEKKIATIEPEVERLSRLKESTELINNQLMFKGSSIDVIRELYRILPKDASLTLLEFDDKGRLLLRGTAKELSSAFNLLPILEKSPYFESAKINYAAKRSFKQAEFADFEIVCQMSKF
ncbi:MAG: pilus assembly protein PilM [Candidatus Omnitrophica bacterium]|nr:pilus assembly protein PilM [Candidatus Omnitrophota bacterium]